MKKLIALCLIFVITLSFAACSNDNSDSAVNYYSVTSEKEAISYSQYNLKIYITNYFKLKFADEPDWGTCTAELDDEGNWRVTLKGTITGYIDDYKTISREKKFMATCKVIWEDGRINNVVIREK